MPPSFPVDLCPQRVSSGFHPPDPTECQWFLPVSVGSCYYPNFREDLSSSGSQGRSRCLHTGRLRRYCQVEVIDAYIRGPSSSRVVSLCAFVCISQLVVSSFQNSGLYTPQPISSYHSITPGPLGMNNTHVQMLSITVMLVYISGTLSPSGVKLSKRI